MVAVASAAVALGEAASVEGARHVAVRITLEANGPPPRTGGCGGVVIKARP